LNTDNYFELLQLAVSGSQGCSAAQRVRFAAIGAMTSVGTADDFGLDLCYQAETKEEVLVSEFGGVCAFGGLLMTHTTANSRKLAKVRRSTWAVFLLASAILEDAKRKH
jgi:hypothetical protein